MQWDADKLKQFIAHYGLRYKDVGNAIGVGATYVGHLVNGDRPINGYASLLTAYLNALKSAKVAETEAYCHHMIEYYNSF